MFAPTPPLEAFRALLSAAATRGFWPDKIWNAPVDGGDNLKISCIDISRACSDARTSSDHPVYVEFPPEDPDFGKDFCGKLNAHMYGMRPAADGRHRERIAIMADGGFGAGQSWVCLLRRKEVCDEQCARTRFYDGCVETGLRLVHERDREEAQIERGSRIKSRTKRRQRGQDLLN